HPALDLFERVELLRREEIAAERERRASEPVRGGDERRRIATRFDELKPGGRLLPEGGERDAGRRIPAPQKPGRRPVAQRRNVGRLVARGRQLEHARERVA